MTIVDELNNLISDVETVGARKENLLLLKQIQTAAQRIMSRAVFKITEIHREEDRARNEERELPFSYDRKPFQELAKEKEQENEGVQDQN